MSSRFIVHHVADSFSVLGGGPLGGVFGPTQLSEVDVTVTDPPYSEQVHENLCSGSLVGKKSVPKYELEYRHLMSYTFIQQLVRITRRWVLSFTDVEGFGLIKMAAPEAYVRGGIWAKKNAMGQLTADRPATAYEGIACLHGDFVKKRWNGKGSYGLWSANGTRGKPERHPNEKPLDLCLKLVALFSERGETVFDPFMGAGTIGKACMLLGRNYIGLDNDYKWVARSAARIGLAEDEWGKMPDEEALSLCKMWGKDAT